MKRKKYELNSYDVIRMLIDIDFAENGAAHSRTYPDLVILYPSLLWAMSDSRNKIVKMVLENSSKEELKKEADNLNFLEANLYDHFKELNVDISKIIYRNPDVVEVEAREI